MRANGLLALALIAASASGVQPGAGELATVQVKVSDAGGHSIDNLLPDDFVLTVDRADSPIACWTKSVDYFHHATYLLAFPAKRSVPVRPHAIAVRVRTPDAKVRYRPSSTW